MMTMADDTTVFAECHQGSGAIKPLLQSGQAPIGIIGLNAVHAMLRLMDATGLIHDREAHALVLTPNKALLQTSPTFGHPVAVSYGLLLLLQLVLLPQLLSRAENACLSSVAPGR